MSSVFCLNTVFNLILEMSRLGLNFVLCISLIVFAYKFFCPLWLIFTAHILYISYNAEVISLCFHFCVLFYLLLSAGFISFLSLFFHIFTSFDSKSLPLFSGNNWISFIPSVSFLLLLFSLVFLVLFRFSLIIWVVVCFFVLFVCPESKEAVS